MLTLPSFSRVASDWSFEDRWGAVRCRLGGLRMRYQVSPGLYALGNPDSDSPVFVTANYKLSFDILRGALRNSDGWILVLDTKGINVWCAAGEGTLDSEELISRIEKTRLAEIVRHRTLVVPQLAAPGVRSHLVEQRTGFHVRFGPVYARDLPAYLSNGYSASAQMRRIRFGIGDRLVLTPMELSQWLMYYPAFVLTAFIIAGLTPKGVLFRAAWTGGIPLFLLGLISIFCGCFLTPLLLPFIPFRAFSLKGWSVGLLSTAAFLQGAGISPRLDPFLVAACCLFFPAASAFMALNFTGATPFTSLSGVKKEIRLSLPFFVAALVLSVAAVVFSKLRQWSLI